MSITLLSELRISLKYIIHIIIVKVLPIVDVKDVGPEKLLTKE
jgi:hypothetical protein